MTHTYSISGMTCSSCEEKVQSSLRALQDITNVIVSKDTATATITMNKHIPLRELQNALGGENGRYTISAPHHNELAEQSKTWFQTYKPIILIFTYITGISVYIQVNNATFDVMQWMRHFMAGFFFVFSFFKLINLEGFSDSYRMYDVIARRFPSWSYIYAFTELLLGIGFFINAAPLITNITTFIIMSVSIIGVLQTVLNKKRIRCACLGDVFNLPMSTVTIIEDGLMIVMSAYMIWLMV